MYRVLSESLAVPVPGCRVDWNVQNGTSSGGGTPKSFTTSELCLANCVDDLACLAADLDFAGTTLCWHHTNAASLDNTRDTPNIYQHRIVDRCVTDGTLTSRICRPDS